VQFIEGCPRDWAQQLPPGLPLIVGLDGGYVHAADQKSRTKGWFEVIAGKSVQAENGAKVFAFVNKYDTKPKRRLYEAVATHEVSYLNGINGSERGEKLSKNSKYLENWPFHFLGLRNLLLECYQEA
jgi:hypothetical protein